MSGEEIVGTANPRAIGTLIGVLGLRAASTLEPPPAEIRDDGSVIWRLNGGITVEMQMDGRRFVRWHLDHDDTPEAPRDARF